MFHCASSDEQAQTTNQTAKSIACMVCIRNEDPKLLCGHRAIGMSTIVWNLEATRHIENRLCDLFGVLKRVWKNVFEVG